MTQKEIKQNMTQGEWNFTYSSKDNNYQIYNADTVAPIANLDNSGFSPANNNVQAICHAVNNTYGIGIDPTKVGEMHRLLSLVSNILDEGSNIANGSLLHAEISNLLNSAKL